MASTNALAYAAHEKEYGVKPKVMISTPGRFHLMGEHSSWFFKDKTMSMAVNLPVIIASSVREDSQFHFNFVQLSEKKKATLSTLKVKKEDRWANFMKAMIYGFTSGGFTVKGMDFTVYSEILPSAGFGIATAIKIGTAVAIKTALRINCSDAELLQVIERGNRLFLHTRNYIADNFAALYSKPGCLIITNHATQTFENVPFEFAGKKILLTDASVPRISIWDEEIVREPENALLLGDLKEKKNGVFGGWVYESNPTEINEVLSVVSEDMRHKLLYIIKEHQNVLEAYDGIINKNFAQFARAVNYSHRILGEFYDMSCPEIDWVLKRVHELEPSLQDIREPVTCGRLTGKGFGRCLFAVVRDEDVDVYYQKLEEYERIFGFKSFTHEVKPAKGSHQVRP